MVVWVVVWMDWMCGYCMDVRIARCVYGSELVTSSMDGSLPESDTSSQQTLRDVIEVCFAKADRPTHPEGGPGPVCQNGGRHLRIQIRILLSVTVPTGQRYMGRVKVWETTRMGPLPHNRSTQTAKVLYAFMHIIMPTPPYVCLSLFSRKDTAT